MTKNKLPEITPEFLREFFHDDGSPIEMPMTAEERIAEVDVRLAAKRKERDKILEEMNIKLGYKPGEWETNIKSIKVVYDTHRKSIRSALRQAGPGVQWMMSIEKDIISFSLEPDPKRKRLMKIIGASGDVVVMCDTMTITKPKS